MIIGINLSMAFDKKDLIRKEKEIVMFREIRNMEKSQKRHRKSICVFWTVI